MRTLNRTTFAAALTGLFALAASLGAAAAGEDAASAAALVDQARYVVSVHDHTVGTEDFTFRELGDSLCLYTEARMVRGSGAVTDTILKRAFMAVDKSSYLLLAYQSNQSLHGRETIRGIVPGDTLFTLYREINGKGTGDRLVLPPGRMYVIDPMLYSLMNFVCMTLKDQGFDSRPVTLLTLGARDSIVEARMVKVGTETLMFQQRSVQTRHWRLSQGGVTFEMWVDSRGRLLRITNEPSGLRVERFAPKVKPRAASAPKPSG